MKASPELLIAGGALVIAALAGLKAATYLGGGWNADRGEQRIVLSSDELVVVPIELAIAPLRNETQEGPRSNPWEPSVVIGIRPQSELPPPPPVPLPLPPFMPIAEP